jgi:hypothetical protein
MSVAQVRFRLASDSHASSSRLRCVKYGFSRRTCKDEIECLISVRTPLKIFVCETKTRATSRISSCICRRSWTREKVRSKCGSPLGVSTDISSCASRLCRQGYQKDS